MFLCWVLFMLSSTFNITYNPLMLSVIMLNVVMLSVVAPHRNRNFYDLSHGEIAIWNLPCQCNLSLRNLFNWKQIYIHFDLPINVAHQAANMARWNRQCEWSLRCNFVKVPLLNNQNTVCLFWDCIIRLLTAVFISAL